MLCQRCQELFTLAVQVSGSSSFPHQICIEDWKDSIESRCMICATVWFRYTPDEQQKLDQLQGYKFETYGLTSMFVIEGGSSEFVLDVQLGPSAATSTNIPSRFISFKARKETDKEKSLGHNRLVLDSLQFSASTNSPEVFSLAREGWISQCQEKHTSCSKPIDTKWYPTRLLTFRSTNETDDPIVSLVETNTFTPSGPYMTLSHSWGRGHIITLNKQSYQGLLHGMPLSSLPPTFRDACIITEQVGMNYLWIDALCIFQYKDDLSDWSREASLMHKVYSFSHCNIVAGDNANSSEPIFRARNPRELSPPTTEIRIAKSVYKSQLQESTSSDKYILDKLNYWKPVKHAHINTRGWVMQERLLSPRALHFGAHQVYWECRECMASETNPDGFGVFGNEGPFKGLMIAPDGHRSWSNLVMDYSASALSFPKDKLVAISAVARVYASYLSDEYVAGMWHSHLQNDLLWRSYDIGKAPPTQYDTYTAPSWSWASVNGEIVKRDYHTDRVQYLYNVDSYELEYATEDKMGAVLSGWLRLSGQLRKLRLLDKIEKKTGMRSIVRGNIETDRGQDSDQGPLDLEFLVYPQQPPTEFDAECESDTLYCMLARRHLFNERGGAISMWDFLLFRSVDPSNGTFRRVGLAITNIGTVEHPFSMSTYLNRGASSEPAEDGHDTTTFPCAAYEGGVHSIYVI
ncbi:hypothetical protein NXS19_002681 [Fusarium pseudograminearum]|nr:hypothetical protein NXS19_002681 [Fusarium pseudograminearum]